MKGLDKQQLDAWVMHECGPFSYCRTHGQGCEE